MERQSVQHSGRVDDEMAAEVSSLTHGAPVESHAEEEFAHEPAGDGDPEPDRLTRDDVPVPPGALDPHDVDARSDLARFLSPSRFPCDRDAALTAVRAAGAPESVIALVEQLPPGRYATTGDIWRALGGATEQRDVVAAEPAPEPAPEPGPRAATRAAPVRSLPPPVRPSPVAEAALVAGAVARDAVYLSVGVGVLAVANVRRLVRDGAGAVVRLVHR